MVVVGVGHADVRGGVGNLLHTRNGRLLMRGWGLLIMLTGCVAETAPYVREQGFYSYFAVGQKADNPWFVDGPPLLITVYNPLDTEVWATFTCVSQGNEDMHERMTIKMTPKSSQKFRGQVMNRDMHADACFIMDWHAVPKPKVYVETEVDKLNKLLGQRQKYYDDVLKQMVAVHMEPK